MTPQVQLMVSVLAPFVAVLLGVLFNNQRLVRLEARMDRLDGRMDGFDGQLHKVRDEITASRTQSHTDALLILRNMTELHERVAKVETRQGL